jgi:hypothetical protein
MNVRNVRPYRATTTSGPVVVVAHTYAEAMALLDSMGYVVEDMRGMVPVAHPHAWHNVISPAWYRADEDDMDWDSDK